MSAESDIGSMSPPDWVDTPLPAGWWPLGSQYPTRYLRGYVRGKLALDPVYRAVFAEIGTCPLPVLDIGCGVGLLAAFLRSRGHRAPLHGLDLDAEKIEAAQRTLGDRGGLSFRAHDARDGLPPHRGHVVMLDILQYFSPDQQRELLAAAADRLAPTGRLIIRSCLSEATFRHRITRAVDRFASKVSWMKAEATTYPPKERFFGTLEPLGLEGRVQHLSGVLPFNNYLLVFVKKGGAEAPGRVYAAA